MTVLATAVSSLPKIDGFWNTFHEPAASARVIERDDWLYDDELDDDVRALLASFTTPRRGFAQRVCWPLDEVSGDE